MLWLHLKPRIPKKIPGHGFSIRINQKYQKNTLDRRTASMFRAVGTNYTSKMIFQNSLLFIGGRTHHENNSVTMV